MDLEQLRAWADHKRFNDIEFYQDLEPLPEGIVAAKSAPVRAFAQHGSASLYAFFEDNVVWIDSEGEQYVIAKDFNDFVDALHLYAGALYDAMAACQRPSWSTGEPPGLDALQLRFGQAWIESSRPSADDFQDQEAFAMWAAEHGRGVPTDLPARLVALRPVVKALRAACGDGG